jgi:hypothetical protein
MLINNLIIISNFHINYYIKKILVIKLYYYKNLTKL